MSASPARGAGRVGSACSAITTDSVLGSVPDLVVVSPGGQPASSAWRTELLVMHADHAGSHPPRTTASELGVLRQGQGARVFWWPLRWLRPFRGLALCGAGRQRRIVRAAAG